MKSKTTIEPGNIPFADMLCVLAPKDLPSRQRKLFTDFLCAEIKTRWRVMGFAITDGAVVATALDNLELMKRTGVPLETAKGYAGRFTAWRKAKVSSGHAKGARAKAAKQAAEKLAKAQEAAKHRQAKETKTRVEYHPPADLEFIAEMNRDLSEQTR